MKAMFLPFFAGAVMSFVSFVRADTLPVIAEKPWDGFWVGYEEREFDFGVKGTGAGEMFLKERVRGGTERITDTRSVVVNYLVEEKRGEAWQKRSLKEDELESELAASLEVKECSFVANYTGGAKMKVNHRFQDDEVFISIELLEGEKETGVRVGIEVEIPDLYRIIGDTDKRDIKRKMRGDKIQLIALDGKKVRYDLSDEINLETEKGLEEGVSEFSLECKNLAERTIVMRSAVEKTGKISFRQKGSLDEGFSVIWYPAAAEEGKAKPELVIQVK